MCYMKYHTMHKDFVLIHEKQWTSYASNKEGLWLAVSNNEDPVKEVDLSLSVFYMCVQYDWGYILFTK